MVWFLRIGTLFGMMSFLFSSIYAIDCVVSLRHESSFSCLNEYIPDAFYIKKLIYTVPRCCDEEPLRSMLGITEECMYTRRQFKAALLSALKAKRFDSVAVHCMPVAGGYTLHLDFSAQWIFSRVVLSGIVISKERYKNYYSLNAGDVFDSDKHRQSLQKISALLHAEGYCAASVQDTIAFNEKTGLITVYLKIVLGPRFTITDIRVTSDDETALEKKIIKQLKYLRKSLYTKELVDHAAQDLKNYLQRKGYYAASISAEKELYNDTGQVKIRFAVKCGPKAICEFIGNQFFSNQELQHTMQLFGSAGELIPPLIIADEIKALYIKKGFFDAEVTFKEEHESTFFCINEGQRYKVTGTVITGNVPMHLAFDPALFFNALVGSFYDADAYKNCVDACIDRAIHEGFWDIACNEYTYKKTGNKTCMCDISFVFGKQRMLAGISVDRFADVTQSLLFAPYALLQKPLPFSLYIIQEQQQWLYSYCQKKGLLYLSARPEFTETQNGIWLTWKFVGESQPVHFGKTFIIGNSILSESYLKRELSFKEGDIWNKEMLQESLRKIKNLGIFESVSLYPCDIADKSLVKDMYLKTVEDSPLELRTRAGLLFISKNFGIRGGWSYMAGGSVVWKNPTQRADIARLDIDMSRYKHTIRGIYVQPWFFNLPLKTEYKVYVNRYDQPFVVGSRDRLYRLDQDGFLIGWARNLRYWQTGLTMGSEWMRIHKLSARLAQAIDFAPWLIDRWVPYFFVEPSFFLEYLDNKLQPTRGVMTMITAKAMVPYTLSQAFFFKLLIEQSCFIPLYNAVFAFRVRAGHLFNQQFTRIMPNERFYLGGAYSLRGYPPDLVPPLNIYNCNGCEHFVPLGGKSMINMNFELRFPVYGSFSGVVFSDWGALAQHHPAELAAGVVGANGFGIRYNTPVGPLRFDIGWKWKRQMGEPCYAWYLTLGNAF